MVIRTAEATWEGSLKEGTGNFSTGSGEIRGSSSFKTRFDAPTSGTNPEELLGAAHALCFSMAFAHGLSEGGHQPRIIKTSARVHLDKAKPSGFQISRIELTTEAKVEGLSNDEFIKLAEAAKTGCPVSKALEKVPVVLAAKMI